MQCLRSKNGAGASREMGFSPWFLGIAATRVWSTCNLFSSFTADGNIVYALASSFTFGFAALAGGLWALKHPLSDRARTIVAWLAFVTMTLATALIILGLETGIAGVVLAATLVTGIGLVLGDAMWIAPYIRLDIRQATFYTFLSVPIGSSIGFALMMLPGESGRIVSMLMPALALLCQQRALAVNVGSAADPEPVYDREPRRTMLFVFGGIGMFSLALGTAHGFPFGKPIDIGLPLDIIQHFAVFIISLLIIWWVVVKRKRMSFSFLWRIEIMLVAAGVLVLSVFPGHLTELALTIIGTADMLMVGVLWITLQDIARHTTKDAFAVFGLTWAVRVLARNIGRVLILVLGVLGASSYAVASVIGIVVFALATSMALLLSDDIPHIRPLFAEDGRIAIGKQAKTAQEPSSAPAKAARPSVPDVADGWLRNAFGLSDREAEVALLIAQGRSKTYIAEQLFLSENTVRTHAKNAYAKIGVHSKQELIDLLQTRG